MTPTLSVEAAQAKLICELVMPGSVKLVGAVGGVVSVMPWEAIVIVSVADPVPPLFVARIVALNVPEPVGVPETKPELVLIERPAGKPVAPKLVGLFVAVI